jgi:hypothetical protein
VIHQAATSVRRDATTAAQLPPHAAQRCKLQSPFLVVVEFGGRGAYWPRHQSKNGAFPCSTASAIRRETHPSGIPSLDYSARPDTAALSAPPRLA